jgi:hypothetical protein
MNSTFRILALFLAAVGPCMATSLPVSGRLPALIHPMSTQAEPLDIWGTCYFYFSCQGNAIGFGKTGAECRAQNGHSLLQRDGRCYAL